MIARKVFFFVAFALAVPTWAASGERSIDIFDDQYNADNALVERGSMVKMSRKLHKHHNKHHSKHHSKHRHKQPHKHQHHKCTKTRHHKCTKTSHHHKTQKSKPKSKSKPKHKATPTTTQHTPVQAGDVPSATVTSPSDPWLTSLSDGLNNQKNPLFTTKKTGVMTYYGQGMGACGDTYTDATYTAAVSQLLYDKWPGATGETNRNPICGPFVSGRYFLTSADIKIAGTSHATIGGDGLINCTPNEQCHVPLTATVYNPANGVSFKVKIVDRCVGCAEGDIDMAPAAFLKLTEPNLDTSGFAVQDYMARASLNVQGRVPVTWQFD